MSPSYNHSYIQANLVRLLGNLDKFSVLSELSLEIDGKEFKPDVCLYQKRQVNFLHDIVKMTEMPLLAIEVLSPSQPIQEILDKSAIYFEAGVQSCWLVLSVPSAVIVLSSADEYETFTTGKVVDK